MATVNHWAFHWVSGEEGDLFPGDDEWWEFSSPAFEWGDEINVTCHPIQGVFKGRSLQIMAMQVKVDPGPAVRPVFSFLVKNVGTRSIPAYAIGITSVGP
jgi:hypothetical protein